MKIEDVLNEFAELEKYNLPLTSKVKYGITVLIQCGNYSYFEAFPEDVKREIPIWLQGYRSTGKWYLLSSTGCEDLSQLMARLADVSQL